MGERKFSESEIFKLNFWQIESITNPNPSSGVCFFQKFLLVPIRKELQLEIRLFPNVEARLIFLEVLKHHPAARVNHI